MVHRQESEAIIAEPQKALDDGPGFLLIRTAVYNDAVGSKPNPIEVLWFGGMGRKGRELVENQYDDQNGKTTGNFNTSLNKSPQHGSFIDQHTNSFLKCS